MKIGLIQNKIVLPTDAPIQDQVLISKVSTQHFFYKIISLQDLWSVPEGRYYDRGRWEGWGQHTLSPRGLEYENIFFN